MSEADKPTRRRASKARRGLMEAAAPARQHHVEPPAAPVPEPTPAAPAKRVAAARPRIDNAPAAPAPGDRTLKYTIKLDVDEADRLEDLVKRGRRALGVHVDKATIFRTLLDLAADDASLRDQMIAEIDKRRR